MAFLTTAYTSTAYVTGDELTMAIKASVVTRE
jgi:hypothetical protein